MHLTFRDKINIPVEPFRCFWAIENIYKNSCCCLCGFHRRYWFQIQYGDRLSRRASKSVRLNGMYSRRLGYRCSRWKRELSWFVFGTRFLEGFIYVLKKMGPRSAKLNLVLLVLCYLFILFTTYQYWAVFYDSQYLIPYALHGFFAVLAITIHTYWHCLSSSHEIFLQIKYTVIQRFQCILWNKTFHLKPNDVLLI